jgi:hypothetical protein
MNRCRERSTLTCRWLAGEDDYGDNQADLTAAPHHWSPPTSCDDSANNNVHEPFLSHDSFPTREDRASCTPHVRENWDCSASTRRISALILGVRVSNTGARYYDLRGFI